MAADNNKRAGALAMAIITLGALFFNHPTSGWIIVLCSIQFAMLVYAFADYPKRGGPDAFRLFVKWAFLVLGCASCSVFWATIWWPRIVVSPASVSFRGYPDETVNITVRNERTDDIYDVQIPFLIGYGKHFEGKVFAKPMPDKEPTSLIHTDFNYCFGRKGEGDETHPQANEREVLIGRISHLLPGESRVFTIVSRAGEKFDAHSEPPSFSADPMTYSLGQITTDVRGDYRICSFAVQAFKPGGL